MLCLYPDCVKNIQEVNERVYAVLGTHVLCLIIRCFVRWHDVVQGIDIRHNKDRKVHRKEPRSNDIYLRLLVKVRIWSISGHSFRCTLRPSQLLLSCCYICLFTRVTVYSQSYWATPFVMVFFKTSGSKNNIFL